MNTICINWTAVAPLGQLLAPRAPFSLERRAQGSAPGPPLSRHPASVKRVNRVEERKLLPESETLWGGLQALRAHHNLGITADYIHGHLGGIHTLSRSRCAGTPEGGGEGGYRSIEAPQINEPSINTPPPSTLALSSPFSLPTLCFLSLALSLTPGTPLRAGEEAASASSVERALTWPAGVN